ncbi:MAG: phage regulatory protein/antirepressor Ant [Methylococcales bacterium]
MTNTKQHSKKFEHHPEQHGNNAMNKLPAQPTKTMLSTEIAALTKKRHDHVMRDIRTIIENLKDSPDLGSDFILTEYKADNGKNEPCYQLNYKATMIVLTGYDVMARAKVIERWQELEQQIDPMQVLNDPAAMRGLLLTYAETVIEKDKVIAEQAPKVAALARLSESDGSLLLTDAAKTLGIQPQKLFQSLREKRWIYKRTGSDHWVAYQDKLQSGYLEHKAKTVQRKDGSEKITEQARVTPKGLTKLAVIFSSGAGNSK